MKPRRSFSKSHLTIQVFGLCVLFILIEGLYSFCSKPKKVDCPAFSDANFDAWFPYQPAQKIYFASSQNRKDTITIQGIAKSPAYQGTGSVASCDMNAQITSQEVGTTTNKLFINYSKFNGSNNLNLILYNFQINGSLTETSYVPSGSAEKSVVLPSATINNHTFSNVVQIELDTTLIKQEGVYKVWLSRQAGLIGYERYPTLEQFVKQ